jgi:hypothetical protein
MLGKYVCRRKARFPSHTSTKPYSLLAILAINPPTPPMVFGPAIHSVIEKLTIYPHPTLTPAVTPIQFHAERKIFLVVHQ